MSAVAAPRLTAAPPLTPAVGSPLLAAGHFAAATLYLVAGSVGLVWIAPDLAAGAFLSPGVGGVTHLFTLGWLTTTIFGALSQLLPAALGAPLRSTRVAWATFLTFVPGAGLLAVGVTTTRLGVLVPGVLLLIAGILLALGNLAATLARAPDRDITWAAVALALGFLASTLVLGMLLAHNLHTGFIAGARLQVMAIHIHVSLVGWVLLMIVGVSHRLLPMFLLAHKAGTRWARPALAALASGLVILTAGISTSSRPAEWAGGLLLAAGVGGFLRQTREFYRARMRRQLDPGMRFAATALAFLAASTLLGLGVLADGGAHARLATLYVTVGLLGGIVLYVIGFFYKIVPLLAWTIRFRGRMGRQSVPGVAQLYSPRLAHLQLGLMAGGVLILAAGIVAGSATAARWGGLLFLGGVLVFLAQLGRVASAR